MKSPFIPLLFGLGLFALVAFSQLQVRDFQHLKSDLNRGVAFRAIYFYGDCEFYPGTQQLGKRGEGVERKRRGRGDEIGDLVGGMDVSTYEYFPEESIGNDVEYFAFSDSELIASPYGDGSYIQDYVAVRVDGNNNVNVTAQYLTLPDYKLIMNETFVCKLGHSARFYAQ